MTSVGGTREEFQTGRAVLLATVAALGGFLFGFDTAVVNGTAGGRHGPDPGHGHRRRAVPDQCDR